MPLRLFSISRRRIIHRIECSRRGDVLDAWGDESIRTVCSPPVYLLAASYREDGNDFDTSAMEAMLPKGARKLHWRDMNDKTRAESTSAISRLGVSHTIVVACNIATNKQERARRKCLETLLPRLESFGIDRYVLESRGDAKDKQDMLMLAALRSKGICKFIRLVHKDGREDSHLWIPDQVLGAYGDIRSGVAKDSLRSEWNRLSSKVTTVEIWP